MDTNKFEIKTEYQIRFFLSMMLCL